MPIVTDLSHIGVDARAYARGCRQLQAWHEECRRRRIAKKIREAKSMAGAKAKTHGINDKN